MNSVERAAAPDLAGKLPISRTWAVNPRMRYQAMTTKKLIVPLAALAIGVGTASIAAAQAGERHHNRQSQSSERSRSTGAKRQDDRSAGARNQREEGRRRGDNRTQEQDRQRAETPGQIQRQPQRDRDEQAGRGRDRDRYRSSNDRDVYRGNSRDYYRGNAGRGYNGYSREYYAPRLLRRGYSSRHYYGTGGRLSLYFGIGSGYRYGSPYYGRVYGYRRSEPTYGRYVSYGDIRLKDFPRDGAVYVDGYYAGIVDDFDGFFQRLTLEVGPHEVEVVVPGDESQFFDVYVDPYNTIDLHADWRR